MGTGKFISFEGGEGSGKSTQAKRLAERLGAQGIAVTPTREPGGSPFAERVRELLLDPATPPHPALSEALLFYAARADHLDKLIRPALAEGRWVITDRFSDSTRVYQGIAGTVPPETIEIFEQVVVGASRPDLTIIIDVSPMIGLQRAATRRAASIEADAFEKRDLGYHERLRDGFLRLAASDPARYAVVDGEQPQDAVAAAVWDAVSSRLLAEAR